MSEKRKGEVMVMMPKRKGSVARAARALAKGTWQNHISILHHSAVSLSCENMQVKND
jgi:hypothetical protein